MKTLTHKITENLTRDTASDHATLLKRMPLDDANRLVVSLSGVQKIDAYGVDMLMRVRGYMRRKNKELVLEDVGISIQRLFERLDAGRLLAPA